MVFCAQNTTTMQQPREETFDMNPTFRYLAQYSPGGNLEMISVQECCKHNRKPNVIYASFLFISRELVACAFITRHKNCPCSVCRRHMHAHHRRNKHLLGSHEIKNKNWLVRRLIWDFRNVDAIRLRCLQVTLLKKKVTVSVRLECVKIQSVSFSMTRMCRGLKSWF
jgi:hypothetical protein